MTEPFIGEIQIFGFNFAPRGWAMCNGAQLAIQQNTALFSLLGTTYGGDGRTTFALPNLTNRAACGQGQGPGLTERPLGAAFGENSVTLSTAQLPAHQHAATLYAQPDNSKRASTPAAGNALSNPGGSSPFVAPGGSPAAFAANVVLPSGGGQPHENRQPYLAMNFCIALQGVFPSFD
ncbi:phage tail protein [Vulcaniibacterium tengchongense]|uniref:Microcystin-dependent protein n=1 Tax=Vulcaniibacterium tengchongense TaxID=1273429 RepID=A0A3N4VJZ0_9GAMM|nr:tail fiber protein [Vulcaniibacterium tengchongense]RPE82023.1 microcystin-dependent protein [Vulcaniibacterium tengchongense]